MRHRLVTPPASEPVTLQEAKDYCRVTHNQEDGLFTAWIKAARELCESGTRMSFITQTRESIYQLPSYSGGAYSLAARVSDPDGINEGIPLLRQPIASITSIHVYRRFDTLTAVGSNAFLFNPDAGRIEWLAEGFVPLLATNDYLKVVYAAGLAVDAFRAKHPGLLEAIKIVVAELYGQRGYSKLQGLPAAAWEFLTPYWSSPLYR